MHNANSLYDALFVLLAGTLLSLTAATLPVQQHRVVVVLGGTQLPVVDSMLLALLSVAVKGMCCINGVHRSCML
jgi:hypothetical protein